MDVNRLSTWEKVAGAAGLVISLSLFLPWWELEISPGEGVGVSGWEGLAFIDIVVFAGGLAVAAVVGAKASDRRLALPITSGALIATIGVTCAALAIYRTAEPPAIEDVGGDVAQAAELLDDADSIGVPGVIEISSSPSGSTELEPMGAGLAVILGGLMAFGGWKLMQSEGTTPQEQFAQLRDRAGGPGGAASGEAGQQQATATPPPPPPPPPATPTAAPAPPEEPPAPPEPTPAPPEERAPEPEPEPEPRREPAAKPPTQAPPPNPSDRQPPPS